jgi:Uma2 family endonuclease
MASVTTSQGIAAAPAQLPDGEALYEVVNGQRVELPPISIYATWITSRLQNHLGPFAEEHRLGTVVTEALFILDPGHDLRRRPDVAFVSSRRWPLNQDIPETGDWEVIPDIAVEVISPNEGFEAVLAKIREYFQVGVQQVWIVSPLGKQLYIYDSPTRVRILAPPEELDGGPLLPGFRLPLKTLFRRPAGNGTPATS